MKSIMKAILYIENEKDRHQQHRAWYKCALAQVTILHQHDERKMVILIVKAMKTT